MVKKMKKIYVVRKKSKNERLYNQLYVDLGYKKLALSFDDSVIVELTGLSFEYINTLELDVPVCVGTFAKAVK